MRFADLLREYIGDRTLEQIAELCAERGLAIDPSYISKWRNGSRLPPDDETVIQTLAEVCGRDPEPLILLAKVERRPTEALEQIITRQFEYYRLTLETAQLQAETLLRISEIVEKKGTMDQVKAALLKDSEKLWELAGARQEMLQRDGKILEFLGTSEMELIASSLSDRLSRAKGKVVARSEDDLIEALAEVTAIPASGLRDLVKALKTAVTDIRRELETGPKNEDTETGIIEQESPVS